MDFYRRFFTATLFFTLSLSDPISHALLSFKSELADNTQILTDWIIHSNATISACTWSCVTCSKNSSSLIGLDLSRQNLRGILTGTQFDRLHDLIHLNLSTNEFFGDFPGNIFNLSSLETLDISNNNFSRRFPDGVSSLRNLIVFDALSNGFSGSLPVEFSKLDSLRVLNLAGSYFTGSIPIEYGSFSSLEYLHLAGNFLDGEIPPELGMLGKMTHMEIGYNSYCGSLPWQLGNMTQLEYLDIADANLSGVIPKQLCNLTKLESLFLFRNSLIGEIPQEFGRVSPLRSFDLSVNLISGPIPDSFVYLKNLELLSLMFNNMSGYIPQGIANLPRLETLHIWNNLFSGPLPKTLGMYSSLMSLDVSTNRFFGEIPPNICSRGSLERLILFSNDFTGRISPSLSNCSSLVRLRLEDNSFSGEIGLSFLSNITYIDLSKNKLTGGIPLGLYRATKLQFFNVSENRELGGRIPESIFSLPQLQNLSATSCNITGKIPIFQTCESISVIELGNNGLSGAIPDSVSKCPALERIDLACNNLTGHIPIRLASLSSLVNLNLSFNDFSGSIPLVRSFKLMGRSSFIGNPNLCGEPLKACPSVKWRNKTRTLILSAVIVLSAAFLIFGIIYFVRRFKRRWKMVSFIGLPRFKASDVLRGFESTRPEDSVAVCKALLPTGITVLVKKIELDGIAFENVVRMGNVRHKNLVRLLGLCYNRHVTYALYDYFPNGSLAEKFGTRMDWETKCKIVVGIAKGVCFLHHNCCPAIAHGDLKSCNILLDENLEPYVADFGLKFLVEPRRASFSVFCSRTEAGELRSTSVEDELYEDIYNYGNIIFEILTNGRLKNTGENESRNLEENISNEVCDDNESISSYKSLKEDVNLVLEVALLCTKYTPSDRPSMEVVLKLLSSLKSHEK